MVSLGPVTKLKRLTFTETADLQGHLESSRGFVDLDGSGNTVKVIGNYFVLQPWQNHHPPMDGFVY